MTTAASSTLTLRIGIIVLTLVTAIVHLYLGFQGLPLFVLNGIGYLALLAALYLPIPPLAPYRKTIRWVLVGYTALTIVLWLVITGGASTVTGYIDKVVELLLIALLVTEARADR
ncbi:hypothetical protein GBA63_05515 [Rubrobacter tropicus]|uniref:Uncharacterized protein n=1 Tax=Rubrobacter tropicus TaxID=2653851 RepID=A0A6G8Q6Q0_9ACTN|nr:hypothetical protein [Rubrobacter tropicus]QIN82164.1 hypothetical protein GBA63_05515 [Rubrobacter tropicus]